MTRRMKTAVALLALSVVGVACGEGPPGSAPTTTTTAQPSPTSSVADSTTTEAPPAAENEKVDEILGALAALDSYRFEVRYGDAGGEGFPATTTDRWMPSATASRSPNRAATR